MFRRSLLAVCTSALLLGAGLAHGAVSQTIYAYFDVDGNLQFRYADSSNVGSTIPPGTYTVNLNNNTADDYAVDHQFHLFGPGIDYTDPAGAVQTTFTVTFQAGGTYTVQDDLHPTQQHLTIVATSTPAATTTSGGTSTAPSLPQGSTKPTSSDIVGSEVVPFRGSLDAIVYTSGKVTLTRNDRPVSRLPSGRYTFSVDDESKIDGFSVQNLDDPPVTVTTARYVGSHSLTVTLRAGRWSYFSPGRVRRFFTVA